MLLTLNLESIQRWQLLHGNSHRRPQTCLAWSRRRLGKRGDFFRELKICFKKLNLGEALNTWVETWLPRSEWVALVHHLLKCKNHLLMLKNYNKTQIREYFFYISSFVSVSGLQGGEREESHKEMPNQLCHNSKDFFALRSFFQATVNCWHIALSKVDKCQKASFLHIWLLPGIAKLTNIGELWQSAEIFCSLWSLSGKKLPIWIVATLRQH